jgi:hypothetical protein
MNLKCQIVVAITGLSYCLILAAENGSNWKQENPGWQITSEASTNPPYWQIPTNVPFRIIPLKNGKWVWTTNTHAIWFGGIGVESDDAKEQQVNQQWETQQRQMMDASDPPGIANVAEYRGRRWDQKHVWHTNMVENWWGVWVEDTNTGWRVNLCPAKLEKINAVDIGVIVKIGSVVTNSWAGLLPSPDGKYAKFELMDVNGKAVSPKRGAALNLYQMHYGGHEESELARLFMNLHSPSGSDAAVERNYPDNLSDLEYPRLNYNAGGLKNGSFFPFVGFVSNGPPCQVGYIKFSDIFPIEKEGDYTLTVQPVLFRMHYDGGTFQGYLDRVDLPCVTTKVHLLPSK